MVFRAADRIHGARRKQMIWQTSDHQMKVPRPGCLRRESTVPKKQLEIQEC
jgi:hypothetical protein